MILADNFLRNAPSSGETVAGDEVSDSTLGVAKVQFFKLMDGTLGGTDKATVGSNGLSVDVKALPAHLDIRHLTATDDVVVANLSATDNAVLDAIALAVAGEGGAVTAGVLMQGDDGTDRTNVLVDAAGHLQVDVVTAASTAVTNADITTVAGAVAGGHMQVDVLTVPSTTVTATHLDTRHLNATDDVVALGAGTAAIGKLSANPGVDIGDVDVASILPGTAAANLGKAEDAVHSSGDVGVMALAVSKATPELLGAAGDYVPLETDADGRLWVNAVPGTIWTVFHNEPSALANTDTSLAAAPGAGLSLYVTDWIVTNGSTAAITIFLEEDTASTKSPKTATHQVPKDGGFAMKYTTPIKLTANKDLGFTVVNASIYGVEVHGYTAP